MHCYWNTRKRTGARREYFLSDFPSHILNSWIFLFIPQYFYEILPQNVLLKTFSQKFTVTTQKESKMEQTFGPRTLTAFSYLNFIYFQFLLGL